MVHNSLVGGHIAAGAILFSSGYKDISVTFGYCESDLQLVEISSRDTDTALWS